MDSIILNEQNCVVIFFLPKKKFLKFLSKISLSDAEKSLFVKRLRFSFPPKKLNYADYLTNSDSFYGSIQSLDVLSNSDLDFVKTKIKDAALSSFDFYNAIVPQNVSDKESKAF